MLKYRLELKDRVELKKSPQNAAHPSLIRHHTPMHECFEMFQDILFQFVKIRFKKYNYVLKLLICHQNNCNFSISSGNLHYLQKKYEVVSRVSSNMHQVQRNTDVIVSVLSENKKLFHLKTENTLVNTTERLHFFNNLKITSSAIWKFEVDHKTQLETTENNRKLILTSKTTLPKFGTTQNRLEIIGRGNEYSLEVCKFLTLGD